MNVLMRVKGKLFLTLEYQLITKEWIKKLSIHVKTVIESMLGIKYLYGLKVSPYTLFFNYKGIMLIMEKLKFSS